MGEHEANFVVIAGIFEKLMKQHKIAPPAPYEYQEDEAFISGQFACDMWRGATYGTCGKLGAGHEFDPYDERLVLGSGTGAFKRMENTALFEKLLPALPVVVHETRPGFGTPLIRRSWGRIRGFGKKAFLTYLGRVAQSQGSGGAAKLFKEINTASKLGPHTQTDQGTCPGVGL
jgi:hypothetical protein